MLSSGIIDLAIGLAFIFGVTAAISSVITEMIARLIGLRGAYLLLGLRELLDSKGTSIDLSGAEEDYKNARKIMARNRDASKPPPSATGAILGSPILRSQGMSGKIMSRDLKLAAVTTSGAETPSATSEAAAGAETAGTTQQGNPPSPADDSAPMAADSSAKENNKKAPLPKSDGSRLSTWSMRRSLPSYISSRSFADAVIDLVVPDRSGRTEMSIVRERINTMVEDMPEHLGTLGTSLNSLAANADGDINKFRTAIEQWYDDHMDRVSGWYKRHTAWITFVAGGILVLLLNINAITIGRALYSDSATRTAVSTAAAAGNPCPAASASASPPSQQDCLASLEKSVSNLAQAGLPLGWAVVPACVTSSSGTSGSAASKSGTSGSAASKSGTSGSAASKSGTAQASCGLLERYGITTPGDNPWWQVFLAVLGFLATIAALAPGAQFWFGLVVKLNGLRSTGPPPATSGTSAQ
jgi:hypothetical protein